MIARITLEVAFARHSMPQTNTKTSKVYGTNN